MRRQVGLDRDLERALRGLDRHDPLLAAGQGRGWPSGSRPPARATPADGDGGAVTAGGDADGLWRVAPAAAGGDERRDRERRATSAASKRRESGHAAASRASVKSTAPDRSAWPRMMPATPASRRRRTPSRSDTPPATRKSASVARTSRASSAASGSAAAVRQDEPADAAGDELVDERLDGRGRRRPAPRERGEPLRPRVEARPPASRRRRGGSRRAAAGRRRRSSPGRRASHRPRRRAGSGRGPRGRRRAGSGRRPAPRSRPIASRLAGPAGCARRRSRRRGRPARPSSTKCSAMRSGRSVGVPVPAATPGQKTTRERPAARSIAGMTCTRARPASARARGRAAVPPEPSAAAIVSRSSRRWKLTGSDPSLSSVSWKRLSENAGPSRRRSSSRSWRSMTLPSR